MPPPADIFIRAAGGGSSATVLASASAGRLAVAAVDTNSDGQWVEFVVVHEDDDGVWREARSEGSGPLASDFTFGAWWAVGRSTNDVVKVLLGREIVWTAVESTGYWAIVIEAPESAGPLRVQE